MGTVQTEPALSSPTSTMCLSQPAKSHLRCRPDQYEPREAQYHLKGLSYKNHYCSQGDPQHNIGLGMQMKAPLTSEVGAHATIAFEGPVFL